MTSLYRIGSLRFSDAQMYGIDQYKWTNKDISVLGVTISHQDLVEKNYETIIQKASNITHAWQNRGLSLIGKIQVLNTLVASLFVYKMMVLPFIPKIIVKNIDNLFREYIWNNKKSKVALSILQLPKKEGGLGLVDLKKKEISLKATWPQILGQEKQYAELVFSIMRCSTIQEDIWRCTILPHDIKHLKIKEPFWYDVLDSWSQYNSLHELRIENQLIWYNSNIRVCNKPIFWADAYMRGLKFIHQLYDNQQFKNHDQIHHEFGLSILRYNSLKVAIPYTWRTFFETKPKNTFLPLPPHSYDQCVHVYKKGLANKIYRLIGGGHS